MFDPSVRYQYLATFCGNLLTLSYGTSCGWPSAALLVLESDASPLETGALTVDEASWVSSILCIGGILGNMFFGMLSNRCGRKRSMVMAGLPQVIGWLMIVYAIRPMHLYVSRFLSGFSAGGAFFLMPLYVMEISNNDVRGSLGSLQWLSCNIGILLAFVLGHFFSYNLSPIVLSSLPILFLVSFVFFPETPQFLLSRGLDTDAKESLRYYRRTATNEQLDAALTEMRKQYKIAEKKECITWADFNTLVARRSIQMGAVLASVNQMCGGFAMINYTASIYTEAGSNLAPTMSAIVTCCIQVLGVYCSTLLVDRAGRKFLLVLSMTGTGIAHLCLGTYTLLDSVDYPLDGYDWIPLVSVSLIMFFASCGILSIWGCVAAEILPVKIKEPCFVMLQTLSWSLSFATVKAFPYLRQTIGMHGSVYLFAGCSLAGTLYVLVMLPETKGKSGEEIERALCMGGRLEVDSAKKAKKIEMSIK